MIYALRWAAMRAILMFHNCERKSHKTVSTDHNFWRERRAEADSNRGPSAYQPNALPLGQTGSHISFANLNSAFYHASASFLSFVHSLHWREACLATVFVPVLLLFRDFVCVWFLLLFLSKKFEVTRKQQKRPPPPPPPPPTPPPRQEQWQQ